MIEQSHVPGTTPRPRSMPHQWSFAQQREQQIQTLQCRLNDANDLLYKALMRLEGLNTLNVSVHPDVVTDCVPINY